MPSAPGRTGQGEGPAAYGFPFLSHRPSLALSPGWRGRQGRGPCGHVHICPLNSGGTYRTRHLHPYISTVQWRVATLPGSPLNSIRAFLVLPASHGEGKRVPAWTPPIPWVVGLSILLLERERQVGHGLGQFKTKVPSQPSCPNTEGTQSQKEYELRRAQDKARQTFERCQLS